MIDYYQIVLALVVIVVCYLMFQRVMQRSPDNQGTTAPETPSPMKLRAGGLCDKPGTYCRLLVNVNQSVNESVSHRQSVDPVS